MKATLGIVFLCLLSSLNAWAQNIKVTGVVTDKEGNPDRSYGNRKR